MYSDRMPSIQVTHLKNKANVSIHFPIYVLGKSPLLVLPVFFHKIYPLSLLSPALMLTIIGLVGRARRESVSDIKLKEVESKISTEEGKMI
jgi:hypothetical protein